MVSTQKPMTRYECFRKARSHEANGEFEDALKAYDTAIEISNTYAHAYFYKSRLLFRMQKYGECIGCAEKARQLEPTWSNYIAQMIEDAKKRL
jgi:tetratricopeptide (TPR) repeat protein